jgi:hypothetical protein
VRDRTRQTTIIKALADGRAGEAPYREFERFIEMAYCALAKALAGEPRATNLEARYQRVADAIGAARTQQFGELLGELTLDLLEGQGDSLGAIAQDERIAAVNGHIGQYFTPPEVSRLMAEMTMGDLTPDLDGQPYITIAEPASGAGGMILATAAVLKARGVDANRVWFDATDLADLCFKMTFVQMSLAGCRGIARCGNTLDRQAGRGGEWAVTAASCDFLTSYGWPGASARDVLTEIADQVNAEPPAVAEVPFALEREPATKIAIQGGLF